MTIKELLEEIKKTEVNEDITPYEILCSVLRATDDTEKRMANVSSFPSKPSKPN